jgi:nitrogen fixation protein NifZ
MIDLPDPDAARFQWGQPVWAAVDLYNDGSLPDTPEDALIVVAGGPGEVVQIGRIEDNGAPVYMVDFGVAVLGCLEDELSARPLAVAVAVAVAQSGTAAPAAAVAGGGAA